MICTSSYGYYLSLQAVLRAERVLPPFFSFKEFSTFLSFLSPVRLSFPASLPCWSNVHLLQTSQKFIKALRGHQSSYRARAILCSLSAKQWQSFFLEIQAARWNHLVGIFWITSLFQGLTLNMAFTGFLQLNVLTLTYQENAVYTDMNKPS